MAEKPVKANRILPGRHYLAVARSAYSSFLRHNLYRVKAMEQKSMGTGERKSMAPKREGHRFRPVPEVEVTVAPSPAAIRPGQLKEVVDCLLEILVRQSGEIGVDRTR